MMDYRELYDEALKTTENSYTPYSHFNVGAAILAEDGRIFRGCNIENASYGATICAERCAVSCAVSAGCKSFKAIAIAAVSDGKEHSASPCGICRQVIFEFGDDIDVIYGENRESLGIYKITELLPGGFRLQAED